MKDKRENQEGNSKDDSQFSKSDLSGGYDSIYIEGKDYNNSQVSHKYLVFGQDKIR